MGETIELKGSASGGSGGYTYSWTGPGGYTSSLQNPTIPNATLAMDGDVYTLEVTDSNGCKDTDPATVVVYGLPVADAGPDQHFCPPDSVIIGGDPTASGGAGGYTYSWLPTTGLNDSTIANPTASPTTTNTYTVTVTDANGCQDTDEVTVSIVCPVCSTAVAAQNTDNIPGSNRHFNAFPGSNWFTWISYDTSAGHNSFGTAQSYPIYTDTDQLCGWLYVWNVGDTLYVRYTMETDGWIGFSAYHLQVDANSNFATILNDSGNPQPGQCEYKDSVDTDEIEVVIDISGTDPSTNSPYGDIIYIFAHSMICYWP